MVCWKLLPIPTHASLCLDVGFTPMNVKFYRLKSKSICIQKSTLVPQKPTTQYYILYDHDGEEKFRLIKYFLELQRITNTSELLLQL